MDAGLAGQLSVWGIISDAALNYFWLFAIACITLILGNPSYFLPLAIASASVSILLAGFWLGGTYIWQQLSPASYEAYLSSAWWCLLIIELAAFFRILSWYCPTQLGQRLGLTFVYSAIILWSIWYLPPQSMFYEPWDEQTSAYTLDVEETYYAQANLMKQALHQISAEDAAAVDIFAIGFAAYGDQDVFMREVESGLAILSERFSNDDKSLALINNRQSVLNKPLATRHNLQRGIRQIAAKMNLDQDIMLIFLSSHGNEDGSINVELGDLNLSDLDVATFRQYLDESHIYWRIIIISACFSGSFIDELKSPSTLIITAAAADKASFGCEHQRDWTYFGEAFFAQALPEHATIAASFEAAKQILGKRELAEGKEPSEPQMWMGDAIKAYLSLHAL